MVKKMVIHGLPDGAGPGDIVGAFANEVGIDGRLIGKISFLGTKAIVEVDKRIYEKVIRIMDGNSIAGQQIQVSKEKGLEKAQEYVQGFTRLVQLERDEEMERFLHEVKKITGYERQKRGRALLHLKAVKEAVTIQGGYLLSLSQVSGDYLLRTEISVGHWVMISQGNPLAGNRRLGIVAGLSSDQITLFFHTPLEEWLSSKNLRIDLYMDDAMFKSIFKALKGLNSLETISTGLSEILLDSRAPAPGFYAREPVSCFYDGELNTVQKEAVDKALRAEDLFLIEGGPGTGKTRVLQEIIRQGADQGLTTLVTAGTKEAIRRIFQGLKREGLDVFMVGEPFYPEHSLESSIQDTPEFYQIERRKEKNSSPTMKRRETYKEKREEEIEDLQQQALQRVLSRGSVVCTAASTCGCEILSSLSSDLLVMDDANKIMEPLAMIPFHKAKKVIMAGDENSLSPPLLSPRARDEGLAISLFERLLGLYRESKACQLTKQYRMNPVLSGFINKSFYQDNLETASKRWDGLGVKEIPGTYPGSLAVNREESLLFFDTSTMRAQERSWANYQFCENPVEADLVVEILTSFLHAGFDPTQIGVITPYVEQANLIRNALENPEILVGIPSLFLGLEKDLIIISMVRSNTKGCLGRLKDKESMNLALSRSKEKAILLGSGETLKHHSFYRSLIEYIKEHGFFFYL